MFYSPRITMGKAKEIDQFKLLEEKINYLLTFIKSLNKRMNSWLKKSTFRMKGYQA